MKKILLIIITIITAYASYGANEYELVDPVYTSEGCLFSTKFKLKLDNIDGTSPFPFPGVVTRKFQYTYEGDVQIEIIDSFVEENGQFTYITERYGTSIYGQTAISIDVKWTWLSSNGFYAENNLLSDIIPNCTPEYKSYKLKFTNQIETDTNCIKYISGTEFIANINSEIGKAYPIQNIHGLFGSLPTWYYLYAEEELTTVSSSSAYK